jgi:hypothetical protein
MYMYICIKYEHEKCKLYLSVYFHTSLTLRLQAKCRVLCRLAAIKYMPLPGNSNYMCHCRLTAMCTCYCQLAARDVGTPYQRRCPLNSPPDATVCVCVCAVCVCECAVCVCAVCVCAVCVCAVCACAVCVWCLCVCVCVCVVSVVCVCAVRCGASVMCDV